MSHERVDCREKERVRVKRRRLKEDLEVKRYLFMTFSKSSPVSGEDFWGITGQYSTYMLWSSGCPTI